LVASSFVSRTPSPIGPATGLPEPVRYKYPTHPNHCQTASNCLRRWNRWRVPKRRLSAIRRRGNTQKKTHYM
jgi:hypothetical protein